MGSSQCYLSQNTQVPFLHRGNPMGNYVSLWISRKSTHWLRMTKLTIMIQSALCQTRHNTWQGSHYSVSSTAPKNITACRWRTNVRWKCSHSILPAKLLPTEDLLKVSADMCLLFQVSCASTWTQLSKFTNVLNTWMTLESQLKLLRILPGTFAQSSSVFAMQDWNWQLRSATSESEKSNS